MNRLDDHLRQWLGAWPPRTTLDVVGTPARTVSGWDGQVRPFLGVEAPGLGTVVSVTPTRVDDVRALVDGQATLTPPLRRSVARLLGGGTIAAGVFRHAGSVPGPDVLPDVGTWVAPDDPRIPPWLRPFNGGVLLAFDDTGAYAAGVGVKRHDDTGHELSVGTDQRHRGRGLARRLVAQAARDLRANGAVVTYLHAPDNVASARVADAAGFPDRGWRVWGLFREETP